MKKLLLALPLIAMLVACDKDTSCDQRCQDRKTSADQAEMLGEAQRQIGIPSIVNFQEKRMLKTIYELRDSAIATHTYIVNQMSGCLVYIGPSVGYGMPYATQYSNPETLVLSQSSVVMPQAEPNGLFMPADAHGTWILLKDPNGTEVKPVYIEPDVMVVPFRLKDKECK